MKRYITFGQRYAREPHPFCSTIDSNSLLEAEFDTEDFWEFRKKLREHFCMAWAAEHAEGEVEWRWHPDGVTHRVDENGFRSLKEESEKNGTTS